MLRPNPLLNKLFDHTRSQHRCPRHHVGLIVSSVMLWQSPTSHRLHSSQSNILKHLVADSEASCITTPCQPTSQLHSRNSKLNLAVIIGCLLACRPHQFTRSIPWRAEKAYNLCVVCGSETLGTKPQTEGWRSSPISLRSKERVPDSSDAGICPSFGRDTEATFADRAVNSTVTHGWQSSQIICSTSFCVQLFVALCSEHFLQQTVSVRVMRCCTLTGTGADAMHSESTIAQLSQKKDFR